MSIPSAWPQVLDFFGTQLVIEPSQGQFSGDAGLLPIRQFDQRIGLTRAFAAVLDDRHDPDLTEHTFLEIARSRIYGILAGYEDQNDHVAKGLPGRQGQRQGFVGVSSATVRYGKPSPACPASTAA